MGKTMKKIASILLTFAMVLGLSAASMAQTATPRVDRRERHQQRRIRQGVRSGSLTAREAARLERQQARVRAAEARAKSDGTVTHRERKQLRSRVSRTNRNIYRQKRDAQRRNH
jgi:uncharacterized membrane protein YebE (DUF533 family)